MNILISACLLGEKCRYDAKICEYDNIQMLREKFTLIAVCPEVLGGLAIPRSPAEICGDKVKTQEGKDVTADYLEGAQIALEIAKRYECEFAVLKSRSPSCGNEKIYDGTFSRKLVEGMGITAKLLSENGIKVYNENELDKIAEMIK